MVRAYRTHFQQLSPNVKIFLAGNAIQGVGLSIYSLLFNLYLKELGYGESTIGNLISTTSLGISFMAFPAAFFIEKFHVKHLVMTAMIFSSGLYFIQMLNTTQTWLFTFGLLASMFQALFNISVSPFYLRNSNREVRVHLFSLNSALNMIAHLIGYLVGGYLPEVLKHFNPQLDQIELFRNSIMIALMVVFLSNLIFLKIKRVPVPKIKKSIFEGLKEKDWNTLARLTIPKLCFAFGGGLIVPFINIYLKERFNLSTKMIGISYAALQLFIFLGIFITPVLVKKTTHLKFIMMTATLSIPFMLTMGLTGNIVLVLSCFFLRGMLMNMSSPITSMFEMEHVHEKECVFASAVIMFFYNLVYTSSTRMGGFLIEKYSFGPTFFMAAFFYLMAIVLYYRFFRQEDQVVERNEASFIEAA
jgi:predicted MFS family arabinose efflux permease